MKDYTGLLVMIDGPDGSGKSLILQGIAEHLKGRGKKIFDLKEYAKNHHSLPEPEELYEYEIILSAEPTHAYLGRSIRDEIIRDNQRDYSALITAIAYSLDRLILYKRIIIPLLRKGKTIIQDRGVTTSLVYQPIQAEPLELSDILSLEGNKLALEHRPDLLIITRADPETCLRRLDERKHKKDHAIFEKLEFQRKVYERFNSKWFRELFEEKGSKVVYLDATKTKEEVIKTAIDVYNEFITQQKNKGEVFLKKEA